jgi:hypothetical protein
VVKQLVEETHANQGRRSLQPLRQLKQLQEGETKMKKTAYTMIAMLVLIGSMALAAQAQTVGRRMIANIPFQFNVGDKTMPAGEYTVTQINPSSDRAVLQLRSKDGSSAAMIQMNSVIGKAGERARLVFNCYGNQHYFAQAWTSAEASGLEALKSKTERATQNELAALNVKMETVTVSVR